MHLDNPLDHLPVFTLEQILRIADAIPLDRFDCSGFGSTNADAIKCARMRVIDELKRCLMLELLASLNNS